MPFPDESFAHLGYLAVFIGTLLEGETVLFLAGLAAQHGYLSLPAVIAVAAVGGFIGDQCFFFIGRRYGNRVLARFPSLAARAPRVHELLRRWDMAAIILVRFFYGLRIAGPILIASCQAIPYWRLALFNFIGVLIWAPIVAGVGYFAGQVVQQWIGRVPHIEIVMVMTVLVLAAVAWLVIQWRRR
jgi:membrane protein DedA with SNARE-associated domain